MTIKNYKKIIFGLLLTLFMLAVCLNFASAQIPKFGEGLTNAAKQTGLQPGNEAIIVIIITNIVTTLIGLVGAFFLSMVIYGGIKWMTAGGADDKINKAKTVIKNALIGMLITFTAATVTFILITILGGGDATTSTQTPTNPTGTAQIGCADYYPSDRYFCKPTCDQFESIDYDHPCTDPGNVCCVLITN